MALPSSLVGYIGLIEAAVAMFGDDNVACLRRKRAHDVGAPCVPDEEPTPPPIGSCDSFAHLHLGIHPPHRRVVCTSIGEIRAKLHLEVDDREACPPSRCQDFGSGLNCLLDRRDIDTSTVK